MLARRSPTFFHGLRDTSLGRAIYDSTFAEITAPFAHAMAVAHAAHGAEIVIKARIAQEHPLLIFVTLPKSTSTTGELTISELFEAGRTLQYQDLPDILWATTGIRMADRERFLAFGKLRNTIIHFAVPDIDLQCETLKFTLEVMEPLVQQFWDLSILHAATEWDDAIVSDGYLQEQIERCGVAITDEVRKVLKEMTK